MLIWFLNAMGTSSLLMKSTPHTLPKGHPSAQKWAVKKLAYSHISTFFPLLELFHRVCVCVCVWECVCVRVCVCMCVCKISEEHLLSAMLCSSARNIIRPKRQNILLSCCLYSSGKKVKTLIQEKIMHIPNMLLCECERVSKLVHYNSLIFIYLLALFCCKVI